MRTVAERTADEKRKRSKTHAERQTRQETQTPHRPDRLLPAAGRHCHPGHSEPEVLRDRPAGDGPLQRPLLDQLRRPGALARELRTANTGRPLPTAVDHAPSGLAWAERAGELVAWTVPHLVNRQDVHGGYRSAWQVGKQITGKDGQTQTLGLITTRTNLTLKKLVWHFRVGRRQDIIGLHAIGPDNTCKWGGWDFDCKQGDVRTRRRNYRRATELYNP